MLIFDLPTSKIVKVGIGLSNSLQMRCGCGCKNREPCPPLVPRCSALWTAHEAGCCNTFQWAESQQKSLCHAPGGAFEGFTRQLFSLTIYFFVCCRICASKIWRWPSRWNPPGRTTSCFTWKTPGPSASTKNSSGLLAAQGNQSRSATWRHHGCLHCMLSALLRHVCCGQSVRDLRSYETHAGLGVDWLHQQLLQSFSPSPVQRCLSPKNFATCSAASRRSCRAKNSLR